MNRFLTLIFLVFFAANIHAQELFNIDSLRWRTYVETQSYPDSIITYYADDTKLRKELYAPNPDGAGIIIEDEYWDDASGSWQHNSKRIEQYDAEGREIYSEIYSWNNGWEGVSKFIQEFDIYGNPTRGEYYYWDSGEGKWFGSSLSITNYDESGHILLYEVYTWDSQTESWVGNSKGVNGYDGYGNQTVYEYYTWDDDQNDWTPDQINRFSYLADGTIYEKEIYQRDYGADTLYLNAKTTSTFHPDGRIEETNNYYRSAPDEELILQDKYSYIYDQDGHLQNRFLFTWDNNQQLFVNSERRSYTTNENGLPLTDVGNIWRNSAWFPNDSIKNEYDAAGHITKQERYIWNSSTNVWRNNFRSATLYDSNNNLVSFESYLWDTSIGIWKGSDKRIYSYDSNHNQLLYEQYRWDTNLNTWYVSVKYINSYDENNNELSREYYGWNTTLNALVGTEKSESTYNEFNQVTSYIRYKWDQATSSWINSNRTENTYDEQGNLTVNSVFEWNNNTSQWIENTRIVNTYDEQMRIVRTDNYYLNRITSELRLNTYSISYFTNLGVSELRLSFEYTGGEKTIALTSNGNWTIDPTVDWLTITPMAGSGDALIHIIASENQSLIVRTATIGVRSSSSFVSASRIQVEQGRLQPPVPVNYNIKLLPVIGADLRPLPGNYVRAEGRSFTLEIYVADEYDASAIALRINNDMIRTLTNIPGTKTYTYTISEILEDKEIEVLGLKEIPPVSNEIPNHAIKVYTSASNLYVQVTESTEMYVYTISGTYYMHRQISEGEHIIRLLPGAYIIVIDNRSYKVIVK